MIVHILTASERVKFLSTIISTLCESLNFINRCKIFFLLHFQIRRKQKDQQNTTLLDVLPVYFLFTLQHNRMHKFNK